MRISNPFFHRGPIRDSTYFFGREQETGQMLSLLANGQSVSLVGQRRIGKTSLLFHISNAQVLAKHGITAGEQFFVYIDCGGLSDLDQPALYHVFLEEIGDTLADVSASVQLEIPDGPMTYRSFERTFRRLTRQGRKPIIMLDEFERMSRNPQLDPDFFSGLRALAAKYPVAYVTASKHPLLELTYADASTLSSPFFNIFANIRLHLFSPAQARELLTGLAATQKTNFLPDTLAFILNLAGPHPLFLQIAGFHTFELQQARDDSLAAEDYPILRRRFLASVEEHFSYYWRSLSDEEQRVLVTLPAAQTDQANVTRRLAEQCLVWRQNDHYHHLSDAFRDFAQAQPVAGLLQAGPLAIDPERRQLWLNGHTLNMTPTQYSLLLHLAQQAGQVATTENLELAIWGDEYIEDPERLKSVIKGLRRALGDESARLENLRGVGYVWRG